MQLLRVGKGPLGVSFSLGDGLHLQVNAALPCPCGHPLRDRHLLEHVGPQLEAPVLAGEALAFPAQDTLHLREVLVSHAHGLIQGNATQRVEGGMSQDHI
jgi:hypothetical protein